jgi:hypothetical protein
MSASAFRSSNRSSMGSNVYTVQQQGGGNKKAGFPYQVGRDSWASIALGSCDPTQKTMKCASLKCMQFTINPKVSQSRSIGSTTNTNRYFHIPGTR